MRSNKRKLKRTLLLQLPLYLILFCMALLASSCQATTNTAQVAPTSTPEYEATGIKTRTTQVTNTPTFTAVPTPTSQFNIDTSSMNGLKITFWHFSSGIEGRKISSLVEEYNRTNPFKYSVEAIYKGGVDDLYSELNHALTSTGKMPDLTLGFSYQAQKWEQTRPVILDQNAFILDPIWGLPSEDIKSIFPEIFDSDVVNDKRWGFPAWRNAEVLYYNQSWASELGFKQSPASLLDLKKQVCSSASDFAKKQDENKNGKGGLIISTHYSSVLAWLYAFESEIVKPDFKGYQFNTSAAQNTFAYLRDLYDEQCSWLPKFQPPNSEFANRQGLILSAKFSDIPHIRDEFSKAGNTDQWSIIPFPSTNNLPLVTLYGPSYIQFQSQLPREVASWLFIKWMIQPENQIRLAEAGYSLPIYNFEIVQDFVQSDSSQTWLKALNMVSNTNHEPTLGSWFDVRWTIADANRQLYQWYFEADQIPSMVKLLDQTANDLHKK